MANSLNLRITLVCMLAFFAGCSTNSEKTELGTPEVIAQAILPNEGGLSGRFIDINSLVDYKGNADFELALIYPSQVCDVCDTDIFHAIREYKNTSYYKDMVIFIPVSSYRDMILYNEEYNLEVGNIIPYHNELFGEEVLLTRATFAQLDNNKVLSSFTPEKPINRAYLNSFLGAHFGIN